MTRRSVYASGLLLTVACTAMTLASIVTPRWVSNREARLSMGLHSRCSTETGHCTAFPVDYKCDEDHVFCSLWRTVGFLMSFAVVVELCTLVSFVVIISGGVQRRTAGWGIMAGLLLFSGLVQCVSMALVAYLFDHDDQFAKGWYLDVSWSLCTVSWTMLVLTSLGMAASALYLPPEADYEMIPDDNLQVVQDDQLYSRVGAWNDGYREGGYQSSDRGD